MPKLKNLTEADILAARDAIYEVLDPVNDIRSRLEKGYCDHLQSSVEFARSFAIMARACSDVVVHLLAKAGMQEQKAELDALMRERAKLKGKED